MGAPDTKAGMERLDPTLLAARTVAFFESPAHDVSTSGGPAARLGAGQAALVDSERPPGRSLAWLAPRSDANQTRLLSHRFDRKRQQSELLCQ